LRSVTRDSQGLGKFLNGFVDQTVFGSFAPYPPDQDIGIDKISTPGHLPAILIVAFPIIDLYRKDGEILRSFREPPRKFFNISRRQLSGARCVDWEILFEDLSGIGFNRHPACLGFSRQAGFNFGADFDLNRHGRRSSQFIISSIE
jgi:hypothetical protein